MKNTIYLLLLCAVVTFAGCQKDNVELQPDETEVERSSDRKKKVKVCHCTSANGNPKWKVIKVNKNAVRAHLRHGDFKMKDKDGDGFYQDNPCVAAEDVDCDDWNQYVNPACPENPTNGIDDNCDGEVDEGGVIDADGDGFNSEEDCNDDDPTVHPDAIELCGDGIDNNCNGLIDCEEVEVCEGTGECVECNVFDETGFSLSDINVSLADPEESYLREDCLAGFESVYRFKHFETFEGGGGRFFDLAYGINIETGLGIVVASGRFGDNDGNEQFFNNITNDSVDPAIIQKCINNLIAFAQENGYPMESTICP